MRISPLPVSKDCFSRIAESLRINYAKWDGYVNGKLRLIPQMISISRAELDQITQVCESIAKALGAIEKRVKRNRALLAKLGIPENLFELIEAEPESELQLARYDLFPTTDGKLMLSEFNEDVPGGFNEAIGIPRILAHQLPNLNLETPFAARIIESFKSSKGVGLVYATGYSEDLQHMVVLKKILEENGIPALLASPSQLQSGFFGTKVSGSKIDSCIRFYPTEWFAMLENLADWRAASKRLRMMNPFSRIIRQSKNLFSLWILDEVATAAERELLSQHTPLTYQFDQEREQLAEADPANWVLRKAFGRMGDNVAIGKLLKREDWDKCIATAKKERTQYTLQRFFEATPFAVESDGLPGAQLFSALGVYLINGKFAGFYSRAAETQFLTHEAYYVPTVVEDS